MSEVSRHHQQIGKVGGLRRAARRTNEAGRKAAAQAARMARYDAQIPSEITDEVERARLRDALLRADMAELARRSAVKRSRAAGTQRPGRAVA
ncbi:hypothetical protein [Micromonospora costi]|uniref:Uncharacterized protein n=1 Tax=Micromonospora costi TaxID=1530042 RepID=A0A3B0A9Z9_9ACTN|nr:hypothetical protein [Micromonospora costi]RKN55897.1 hypothetical protein D7193_15005 [Micromonospora costi]